MITGTFVTRAGEREMGAKTGGFRQKRDTSLYTLAKLQRQLALPTTHPSTVVLPGPSSRELDL